MVAQRNATRMLAPGGSAKAWPSAGPRAASAPQQGAGGPQAGRSAVQVMVVPEAPKATTVSAQPALAASIVASEPSRPGKPGGDADRHPPATRQTIPATRRRFTPNDSELAGAKFFAATSVKKFAGLDSKGRREGKSADDEACAVPCDDFVGGLRAAVSRRRLRIRRGAGERRPELAGDPRIED